jgi:hypothetical protein
VIFLDSDDFWSDKNLLLDLSELIKKTNADVIVFGYKKLWKTGIGTIVCPSSDAKKLADLVLAGDFHISAWDKVVKRSFLIAEEILFRKETLRNEDVEWCMRLLAEAGSCAALKKVPYVYRQREGSITATVSETALLYVKENFEHCVEILQRMDRRKQKAGMVFLSKELSLFMIGLSLYNKKIRKKYYGFIKTNLEYLSHSIRNREKIIYLTAKVFGISVTERLLRLAIAIRKKKGKEIRE